VVQNLAGWVGNLVISVEHEFFGRDGPNAQFRDRYGREGATVRGLTVEQHLAHLRENLIPLAERCGRVMREMLAVLGALRAAPSQALQFGAAKAPATAPPLPWIKLSSSRTLA
jgi:hypothetical protein